MTKTRAAALLAAGTMTLGLVAAAPSAVAAGTTISTRTTSLGLIVVGASQRTVYLFTGTTRGSRAAARPAGRPGAG